MKDDRDKHTVDGLPAKRGRPVSDPERGPMSAAERVRAYRARQRQYGDIREITLPRKTWDRLREIARRSGVAESDILADLIHATRLPRK